MMSLAAEVADLAGEVVWQLRLDREIPVLVVAIAAVAIDSFRTEPLVLQGAQKWRNRVRKVRDISGRQSVPRSSAFHRIAEIIVLVRGVVDAITRPDHDLAVETPWRPGNADPRSKVVAVGEIE